MFHYDFRLTGITPLIMNRDNIEGKTELDAFRRKMTSGSVKGDDRCPPWSWQIALYHDGTHLAIPENMVMGAIINAAKQSRSKIQGVPSAQRFICSALMIQQQHLEMTVAGKKQPVAEIFSVRGDSTYDEQKALVKNLKFALKEIRATSSGASKSKHLRVRPMFPAWTLEGRLVATEDVLKLEYVTSLLSLAGKVGGVGDWRPSSPKPGPYGRFTAEVWPVVEKKKSR